MIISKGEEIRYPQLGDKLFIEEGKASDLAWLHKMFQELGSYADGYQAGALTLLNTALSKELPRNVREELTYPIVFLMRHYIELRLKDLIKGLDYCIHHQDYFPNHHRIDSLWDDFKKKYSEIKEKINDDRFESMNELIKEFSFFDPISMSFRYPVDKAGNKTQKLEFINFVNLKEVFVRMCFLFDGVSMQISHYVDMVQEMENDVYYDL
jgi:hypothetical protein